ncbi:DoxX family protein [Kutzneria sp. CA-103260]|uniref:DoxX family protein n=1 Tax=Kutzneria sp. CA-103260 TaxID=2802641 RepID=UPI001BACF774|nr:DoxX family protein [Kutzneria sp. CA-103260]QUQ64859.1 DoxX-like family protein [Kutzneria sp. CA-103260]
MTAIAGTAQTTTTTTKAAKAKAPLATKIGRGISAFVVLFLLFDAVMHLSNPDFVAQSFQQQGFPAYAALVTGLLELGCLVLYVIPRTAVLGALFQTAYLGGAFCANLRVEAPMFSTLLFPVYIGILVWAGLYLRNAAVRTALGVDILAKRR